MTKEAFPAGKVEALLRLLDDDSPVVRKAVLGELQLYPEQGETLLREAAAGMDEALAERAIILLEELGWSDGVEAFLEFIRSLKFELETGWLLLDRTVFPTCDVAACHLFMDEMAERCRELMTPPSSPREMCKVMNRVFFHEYGFRAVDGKVHLHDLHATMLHLLGIDHKKEYKNLPFDRFGTLSEGNIIKGLLKNT